MPVDGLDGRQQRCDILAPAQKVPDRPGDLRGRERRCRRLIEQRLKQMVVASVDDGDPDRRAGKPMDGLEAAEPGADHDHMMSALSLRLFNYQETSSSAHSPRRGRNVEWRTLYRGPLATKHRSS